MFAIITSRFIQELCKPLQSIALTNFMHDMTFSRGQISMLVSDENVFSFYYKNKIPTLCTDHSGRTLSDGIYLNKTLQHSRKDCAILMPLMIKVGKQFGQHYGQTAISIMVRDNDCQHLYSLFFDLSEDEFLQWTLNHSHFINDFINDYRIKAHDIILEAKDNCNRITLPTFSDFSSSMNLTNINQDNMQLALFHKMTHIPIHLSQQQSRCLLLLIKGKSAKEIARDMQLSHRTVEHYLEKIRKQLGCNSSKELVAAYSEQLA